MNYDMQMDADGQKLFAESRVTELTAEVANLEETFAAMLEERKYQEEEEKAEKER
jgi:hypothetical protein